MQLLCRFLLQGSVYLGFDIYDACSVTDECRANGQIADFQLWVCRQVSRTEDAWQSEHVLSFEKRPVAVAIHLHCHHIVAIGIQPWGNVEASRVAAVLRESHIVAVYP